jgi:hypothetical protein
VTALTTSGASLAALTADYENELGITGLAGHTVGAIIGDIVISSEAEASPAPGTFYVVSLAIGLFDEDAIAAGALPEPDVDHANFMWRIQLATFVNADKPASLAYPVVPVSHIPVNIQSMRKIGAHQSLRLIGMRTAGAGTDEPGVHAAFNTLLLLP